MKLSLVREFQKILIKTDLPIHEDLRNRVENRLSSRTPLWTKIESIGIDLNSFESNQRWQNLFDAADFPNKRHIENLYFDIPGFDLISRDKSKNSPR